MAEKHNYYCSNQPKTGLSGTRMIPHFSRFGLAWMAFALLLALTFTPGCNRNKSRIPPQTTAATITVPPTGQVGQRPAPPVQITPPPATKAETGAIPQPSTSQTSAKPKPQKNSTRKPPAAAKQAPPAQPAPQAQSSPPKSPATGSSDNQAQIAAQVPQGTAQNTEQLLQSAEGNLRKVTRQLSDGEQAMLRQVRTYIAQSRSASQDGDLERAYNLAMKANLLSGELAK
jgi:outer membrane biosynthesis protein TonB